MQLCKVQLETGEVRIGAVIDDHVRFLDVDLNRTSLSDILYSADPAGQVHELIDENTRNIPLLDLTLLAPVDRQEIWAAGVTYKRSQEARERESVGAARFYDLVYSADRPELFFKANPFRVSGPRERVHVRKDSKWSVPEPELALVVSPKMELVGFTIGNDMSARDIEGENPLYLPQAKIYDHSCALGPVVTLAKNMPPLAQVHVKLSIERTGTRVFEGATCLDRMARTPENLISWLGREASFPHGAILLTGTGIVPPDEFTLQVGDIIHIDVTGIGRLSNHVEQRV